MRIRSFEETDRSAWLHLRRALWPACAEEIHALEMAAYAGNREAMVFVVDLGGGLLGGFIEVSIRDRVDGALSARVGYVEGWYVSPGLRGRGVGRRLMEAAERWAAAHGLNELASDVELHNEDSLEAHRALGFEETFRLVHLLKRLPDG